jgi:predicted anti-sigma-YlaC factor YlaD
MRTDPETEATAYGVGIGIVLIQAFALFPGALACLLLLVPLLVPLVALGLVAALVAGPVYAVRKLVDWMRSGNTRLSATASPSYLSPRSSA